MKIVDKIVDNRHAIIIHDGFTMERQVNEITTNIVAKDELTRLSDHSLLIQTMLVVTFYALA